MCVRIELDHKTTVHVLSAYVPQSGCTDTEKKNLWQELFHQLATWPEEDMLFLCGDLNGHEGAKRGGYCCHGDHGFGARNDNEVRILDSAEANDLILSNIFFKKRQSHLITYYSGRHAAQIDFILT